MYYINIWPASLVVSVAALTMHVHQFWEGGASEGALKGGGVFVSTLRLNIPNTSNSPFDCHKPALCFLPARSPSYTPLLTCCGCRIS